MGDELTDLFKEIQGMFSRAPSINSLPTLQNTGRSLSEAKLANTVYNATPTARKRLILSSPQTIKSIYGQRLQHKRVQSNIEKQDELQSGRIRKKSARPLSIGQTPELKSSLRANIRISQAKQQNPILPEDIERQKRGKVMLQLNYNKLKNECKKVKSDYIELQRDISSFDFNLFLNTNIGQNLMNVNIITNKIEIEQWNSKQLCQDQLMENFYKQFDSSMENSNLQISSPQYEGESFETRPINR